MRRLTTADVMTKLGIRSRETLRQLTKHRGFPRPVHDGGSAVNYYLENEVDEYIRRQAEARDRGSQVDQPQLAA
jgi:predicted DNA-binding transcriptional regulator AlpA